MWPEAGRRPCGRPSSSRTRSWVHGGQEPTRAPLSQPACRGMRELRRVGHPGSNSSLRPKRTSRMGYPSIPSTRTATGLEPPRRANSPFRYRSTRSTPAFPQRVSAGIRLAQRRRRSIVARERSATLQGAAQASEKSENSTQAAQLRRGRSRVCLRFRSPLGGCRQSPEEPPGFGKQIPAVTPPCAVRRSAKLHDGLTSRQGSVGRPSALPRHQLLRPVGKRVLQPPRAEQGRAHGSACEKGSVRPGCGFRAGHLGRGRIWASARTDCDSSGV